MAGFKTFGPLLARKDCRVVAVVRSGYSVTMTTKPATANGMTGRDAKYLADIDECIAEIAAIRREMKKTDAEIRRLESSTRRKLDHIRAHLHVEKAA